MIVVVCLNPALDVTHHGTAVNWAGVSRPAAVHTRPGGKGTNVARNLRSFGVDVLLIGLAGGGRDPAYLTVVDGRGPTALFNEPGPQFSDADYAAGLFSVAVRLLGGRHG
ncbi:MAG TPA: hypothetical protein VGD91_15610 [Trebonia sp.]